MLELALWLKANGFRADQVQGVSAVTHGHGHGHVPLRCESAAQGTPRTANR